MASCCAASLSLPSLSCWRHCVGCVRWQRLRSAGTAVRRRILPASRGSLQAGGRHPDLSLLRCRSRRGLDRQLPINGQPVLADRFGSTAWWKASCSRGRSRTRRWQTPFRYGEGGGIRWLSLDTLPSMA